MQQLLLLLKKLIKVPEITIASNLFVTTNAKITMLMIAIMMIITVVDLFYVPKTYCETKNMVNKITKAYRAGIVIIVMPPVNGII